MADYSISTQIILDDSKFSSGVKNAQKSTKKLSSAIGNITKGFGKGGLAGSITSAGLALGGIGLAVGVAVKAFQKLGKTIGECSEAYKKQSKAEIALETAIKNSSVVTDTATKSLKDYASQLQKTTNLGDEEILPMMTQLIAAGRTEAEVMQIISTASDMSASGVISFDTAVTQLNATLNGNIGRLGQQNAELKGLTEEELKNGKAVEILAGKYKGLAEATVDTKKQLQNAIGDLKESFGAVFEKALSPMRKFFAEIIQGWADARNAKQKYEESAEAIEQGKGTIEQIQTVIEERQKGLEALKTELVELEAGGEDWAEMLKEEIALTKEKIKQTERELGILNAQLSNKQRQEELAKKQAEAEAKTAENEKTVADLKAKYLEKIAEQEARWRNIQTVTGEIVDAEEKIKFYEDNLVSIMTESGGQITKNNQYYKDQLAIIQELQKGLKPEEKETSDVWVKKIREQAIERLEAEKEAEMKSEEFLELSLEEKYRIEKRYNDNIMQLRWESLLEEREEALKSIKGVANEEEEKARIVEYYQNEINAIVKQYSTELAKANEKSAKDTLKAWASTFTQISKRVTDAMKKVVSGMKKIVCGAAGLLKKLFDFNPDTALDNLLAFEDKILTFFVETLPKLPQFFASAFQSISVLLQNILNSGGFKFIGDIIGNILESIVSNLPAIINGIADIVLQIVDRLEPIFDKIIPVLFDVIISTTEKLMKKLPQIIKIIVKVLSTVIQAIVKSLPAILKAIIPNLLKAVLELIKSLLKEIPKIIVVLIKALPDIISAVIKGLVGFLSNLSGKDIAMFVKGFIQAVAQIAMALIQNITKIVAELIPLVVQIIVELIKSIPDILKGLVEGAWEGLKWAGEKIWEGIKGIGEGIKGIGKKIAKGFKKLFGFANGTNDAPRGLALVGEAGPELVKFRGGEQVLNNKNTQKLLADSGKGGSIFNVTFNNTQDTTAFAMLNQLKQYQRNLAFNGIL